MTSKPQSLVQSFSHSVPKFHRILESVSLVRKRCDRMWLQLYRGAWFWHQPPPESPGDEHTARERSCIGTRCHWGEQWKALRRCHGRRSSTKLSGHPSLSQHTPQTAVWASLSRLLYMCSFPPPSLRFYSTHCSGHPSFSCSPNPGSSCNPVSFQRESWVCKETRLPWKGRWF